ncbi:MAG: hypothetical protein H6509_00215 [Bryobacterales bacterium]|nr:hypothetical protein [Bryobacterales bacterium]
MRKDTQAKLLTALLAAGVVTYVVGEKNGWKWPSGEAAASLIAGAKDEPTPPRETIYAMLDAARDGDVAAYITCYTGAMARQLEQSRDEMTPEGFAKYLVERNREIKGVAINEPEMASDTQARIRVEYVYEDRNEVQQVELERQDGRWRISSVDSAQRVKTLVPYGTPVY